MPLPQCGLRCRRCGGSAAVLCTVRELGQPHRHFVICPDCGATGPAQLSKARAVQLWRTLPKTEGIAQ